MSESQDGDRLATAMLQRQCAVCGDEIEIHVNEDNTYDGGHYFGGLDRLDGEYWECDDCYDE